MKHSFYCNALLTTLLFLCFSLNSFAKSKFLEVGMTQEEVIYMLGRPQAQSLENKVEKWEYLKSRIFGYTTLQTLVYFNEFGKVIFYKQNILPIENNRGYNANCYGSDGDYYRTYSGGSCYDNSEFNQLLSCCKRASFDDNKMAVIAAGSIKGNFTCSQVASLLRTLSYEDNKFEMLKKLLPIITDLHFYTDLYDGFSFYSSKEKVEKIVRNYR